MRSLLALACLTLISPQPLFAQKHSRPGGGARQQSTQQLPALGSLFLSGKVVLSDGSEPSEKVLIQTVCRGQSRTVAHTDAHGNFSFQFGDRLSAIMESGFDAESVFDSRSNARSSVNDAKDCELTAKLAGFSSDSILLDGRVNGAENVDLGRIVLRRLANVEGLTISATTAAAPGSARKAFLKGQEQEKKGEWTEAQKSFEKAVRLYEKFAAAWCELGKVQMRQNDLAGARQSFARSIAADEKYISPYHALLRLAVDDQNWQGVIEASNKVLALNAVDFPDAWFFNGVGHFYLDNFATAEESARRGLAVDTSHRIPKLEYLLGMALLKMANYPEASRHFDLYLHLATSPGDRAEAQKQAAEVARLSSARTEGVTNK